MVGHIFPGRITVIARTSVCVTRSNGASRTFSATSDKVERKYDINRSLESGGAVGTQAMVAAHREADRQSFFKIASDMANCGFLR